MATDFKYFFFRERGASAIEFAVIFPFIFLFMYGLISYSLLFAAQHSISHAASEGARAAIRFQSSDDNLEVRTQAACSMVDSQLMWMVDIGVWEVGNKKNCDVIEFKDGCNIVNVDKNTAGCFQVVLESEFPRIIPKLLPMPEKIKSSAVVQIALRF